MYNVVEFLDEEDFLKNGELPKVEMGAIQLVGACAIVYSAETLAYEQCMGCDQVLNLENYWDSSIYQEKDKSLTFDGGTYVLEKKYWTICILESVFMLEGNKSELFCYVTINDQKYFGRFDD